jgi:tetratricopeptide (TPR) repeat protein
MRTHSLVVSVFLASMLGACATARTVPAPSASSLARLEREQRTTPASAGVNRALGIAYYHLGRYPEARTALETAARLDPKDGTTALYLGMTAEAQDDLSTAKRAYSSYLEFGRTTRVRAQLQSRLAVLARKELTLEARAAVQQESALGTAAGSPRTIAVLPLRFSGADSSLLPLERGFAELLTTDLARSSQLTVVERGRLQALLDELTLQGAGATDAASNVRAGRLLRAGRLVQGALLQLPGSQLRVDAAVVSVPTSQIQGTAQGADQLNQLFALEKKIALDLFRELGVTLTVAERNAIEQRPTRSLAAFVAYSRGLVAEDEGRFDDASRFFDDAARLDPGFGAAQQRSAQARAASAGAAVTPATIQTSLQGTPEGAVVAAATGGGAATPGAGSLAGTLKGASDGVNGSTAQGATAGATVAATLPTAPVMDALSAATGTDQPATTGVITIILPRPTLP